MSTRRWSGTKTSPLVVIPLLEVPDRPITFQSSRISKSSRGSSAIPRPGCPPRSNSTPTAAHAVCLQPLPNAQRPLTSQPPPVLSPVLPPAGRAVPTLVENTDAPMHSGPIHVSRWANTSSTSGCGNIETMRSPLPTKAIHATEPSPRPRVLTISTTSRAPSA